MQISQRFSAVIAGRTDIGLHCSQQEPPSAQPDEITVTARKRAERSAIGADLGLRARAARTWSCAMWSAWRSFAEQTPGLSFATAGSLVNRRAVIRGMSQQTRVGDETNVATFIDGVYTPGVQRCRVFRIRHSGAHRSHQGPAKCTLRAQQFCRCDQLCDGKADVTRPKPAALSSQPAADDRLGVSALHQRAGY